MTEKQGQWCLVYQMKFRSSDNPYKPLVHEEFGYVCLHPSFDRTVLNVLCWQRGMENELDPELTKEAEKFIDGITLESAPGVSVR